MGCHPTRCDELEQGGQQYFDDLLALIRKGVWLTISACSPLQLSVVFSCKDLRHQSSSILHHDLGGPKVVAVGECGLDYDRLQFCTADVQRRQFERQLDLAEITGLPLFLHCRAAAHDLADILRRNTSKLRGGNHPTLRR